MALGHTLFRVAVGGTFFAHGAQKLFGWFGGHGLDPVPTQISASSETSPAGGASSSARRVRRLIGLT